MFLEEKGIQYDTTVISLPKYDQYKPEFVRINPNCEVPALTLGDKVVVDSADIMQLLDEHYSQGNQRQPPQNGFTNKNLSYCGYSYCCK